MIELKKPVVRKVTTHTGTPLVVTLTAHGIEFREPRRRHSVLVPYGPVWMMGEKAHAEAVRREKKAARKLRLKQGGR